MATHRFGVTNLAESSGPSNLNIFHGINPPPASIINQGGSGFCFGELEQAIKIHQGVKMGNDDINKASLLYTGGGRGATARSTRATLEMFPSWPIKFQQPHTVHSNSRGGESSDSESALNTVCSTKTDSESPISSAKPPFNQNQEMRGNMFRTGSSQNQQAAATSSKQPLQKRQGGAVSEKGLDAKALRRLAQNREAARKCRIRKKAYVQQLESSRIRLAQLEQDLQKARTQGLLLGGGGGAAANISSGAAVFDMEYARWLEDDERHVSELRAALQSHLPEGELRAMVDAYVTHFDDIFRLKDVAARSDVFHLFTGTWTSPAERCFLWMGGFRPSDLIKMVMAQMETLTEQQFMGLYSLQQSSQQAEDALTQGLDQLQQSLVDTIAGITVATDGMHQMAVALAKLSNLQGFVLQGDNLRQQTLHQLCRILTVRQAARCFIVIGEYYSRLRALSHLWASRPREGVIGGSSGGADNTCQTSTHLQMVHPAALLNQFPTF
ncbi:hypothetical protein V2J09_006389 [Rumex salicifolius]